MTTVAIVAAVIGIGCAAVIYGTDVFCALVLRPAAAGAAPSSIADLIGRIHHYGDRRLPVPGVTSVVAAAVVAAASHTMPGRVAGAVALTALLAWLGIYARISAPINKRLREAAVTGDVPADTRSLQQRWDSVIWARAGLQALALAALLAAAISQ
jgi:hypothetical protein